MFNKTLVNKILTVSISVSLILYIRKEAPNGPSVEGFWRILLLLMLMTSRRNVGDIQRNRNRQIIKRWKEAIMMRISNRLNKVRAQEVKWLRIWSERKWRMTKLNRAIMINLDIQRMHLWIRRLLPKLKSSNS